MQEILTEATVEAARLCEIESRLAALEGKGKKRRREDAETEIARFLRAWRHECRCKYFLKPEGCRYKDRDCPRIHCSRTSSGIEQELRDALRSGQDDNYFEELARRFVDSRCANHCARVVKDVRRMKTL
jgi:hypothetical protein